MSQNSNLNDYNATIKISTLTKIMVISGIIGIIISQFVSKKYGQIPLVSTICKIADIGLSALFSAGLVSVIVEISTIKNLVADAFSKILGGNFPLDGLDERTLKKIRRNVISNLTKVPEDDLKNTVYRYEDNLVKLINSKYYDEHKITYHITPDEKNNCFHVKTSFQVKIINKMMVDNSFDIHLKLYKLQKELTLDDCMEKLKIEKFSINGNDVNTKDCIHFEPVLHNTESTFYDYKVTISKNLTKTNNNVFCKFSYDVPFHDKCQSFKISLPCKKLEHKCFIEPDIQTHEEWKIHAKAYSTFYHKQNDEGSNYEVEQNIDSSVIIRFKDWALVGNGYCVFFEKNSNN